MGVGYTERSVMLRPGVDTRQGTHMESFLLTRSVPGLLMNGCCKSAGREQLWEGQVDLGEVSAQVGGTRAVP